MKIRIFIENDTIYCIIDYSELPEEPLSLPPEEPLSLPPEEPLSLLELPLDPPL